MRYEKAKEWRRGWKSDVITGTRPAAAVVEDHWILVREAKTVSETGCMWDGVSTVCEHVQHTCAEFGRIYTRYGIVKF